ncbi:MAG: carbonic anhydrase [Candidatus Kerfeldbacteria bacterium]|nr:carbonic anhydrase [Candidatus Kerfeldbacteria bacterium]
MPHQAKALVLHCLDFRFIHEIVHFMKQRGLLDQYDDVSVAGAAKNLVDPNHPTDREFILRQIKIAKHLHQIEEVIIINHRDCGAYGKIFPDESAEIERHRADLIEAKKLVQQTAPDVRVGTFLATLERKGGVAFKEIH